MINYEPTLWFVLGCFDLEPRIYQIIDEIIFNTLSRSLKEV